MIYDKVHFPRKYENFSLHSEPSLAERKALATAVSKQEAAQRLLGQCYCTLVLGLGLEDKHHLGCGRYDFIPVGY